MQLPSAWLVLILALCPVMVQTRRRRFQCPPPELISPCSCRSTPFPLVKCANVYSLDTVRKALENRFTYPLPSLYITDGNILILPGNAFSNISVSRLFLNGSNIRQIDENAFVGQEGLRFLALQDDRLFEVPGSALNRLNRLLTLNLAGNLLMKLDRDSFSGINGLKHLVLKNNRISFIDHNTFPSGLETLTLSNNHLSSLNRSLVGMLQLEWIFASNNRLTSIKGEFDGLENLRLLHLSNNLISDISSSFHDLKYLESLNLAYNNIMTIGNGFNGTENLRNLNLSYNFLTSVGDDDFWILTQLEILDLSGNHMMSFNAQSINPHNSLLHLNLSYNEMDSVKSEDFKKMAALKILDLSHNTLESVEGITGSHMPQLSTLKLRDNRIHTIHHSLKNLHSLRNLDIRENKLTTLHENHLAHNKELQSLEIEGNPWSCNERLSKALRDLESRMVRISGQPFCYLTANNL